MLYESASLLGGLRYKGIATNQNLTSFVNYMPRADDSNPYHGYSDEWHYSINDTYQGMMLDPIAKRTKNISSNVVNITGSGANGTKNEIRNDNPAVTWITCNYATPEFKQIPGGRAVGSGYVVLVDGFRSGAYHVIDPVFGVKWISADIHKKSFNMTSMAIAMR